LICDEPTSALDVSIRTQILDLLQSLQVRFGLAILFISHDFSVVRYIADRVMVLHEGKVIELGKAKQLLQNPQHDYTKRLLASVPTLEDVGT